MDALSRSGWRSEAEDSTNSPEPPVRSARSVNYVVVPNCFSDGAAPTPDEWASRIQSVWVKGATNTLELARTVFRARQAMGFGLWARMWRSKDLPFKISKAKMLVRVGERLGDLDGQTFGHLPGGWSVLYQLARLDRPALERLIEEGFIHPGLKLREARQLAAQSREKSPGTRSIRAVLRERLRRFREFVDSQLPGWSANERQLASEDLTQILQQIGNAGGIERGDNSLSSLTHCDVFTDQQDNHL